MNGNAIIYVVDDDEAVLLSVQALLSHLDCTVRCFSSGAAFLASYSDECPGCVITDVFMPEITGIELLLRLQSRGSILSVLVVTGVADVPTAVTAMERGAITLLEKPYQDCQLLQAVERGLEASRQRWQQRNELQAIESRLATLTEEERDVLNCILAGKLNKEIADTLNLSKRTVDRRRRAVFDKFGVNSVAELARVVGTAPAIALTGVALPQLVPPHIAHGFA